MNLLAFAILSVLCTAIQAISFSTMASVTLALSLNKPAHGFFGIFRRRNSPVQETIATTEQPTRFPYPGQQAMSGGFINPFAGFGGGNMFFPGFNIPSFGMFGQNRFPPQFRPPQPMKPQQHFPGQQEFPPQQPPMRFSPQQHQPQSQQQQVQQSQFTTQQPLPMQEGNEFDSEDFREPRGEETPGMNTEEAESFFTLLSETDESKCISRLICEMGANPENGGEFGQTIAEIIGSLNDFPDGSKVSEYNEVLNIGVAEGLSACLSQFSMCDDESYSLVKKAQVDDEDMD